jgi:hypothetical protein
MQSFRADLRQILLTHFLIWRDDRFEPYSSRFHWWNPLGRIQCSRRCANPPGVQIQCLRDQIRDPTLTHFSLEARALLLEQFPAYSDSLNFRTSFPAGSSYRTSPESHIFVDLSVHASDLLSSSDPRVFLCYLIVFQC